MRGAALQRVTKAGARTKWLRPLAHARAVATWGRRHWTVGAALFCGALVLTFLAADGIAVAPPEVEIIDGRQALIIDGDDFVLGSEQVRLLSIDAPSTRAPRCEGELVTGLKAADRLAALLHTGPVDVTRSGRKDGLGRTLASVSVAGDDVGRTLIREGLALPRYEPPALLARVWPSAKEGRRQHWCGR